MSSRARKSRSRNRARHVQPATPAIRTDFRDQPEDFEDALAGLVDQVLAYLADILQPDRELIEGALEAKFELDGQVGSWRQADIARVLDQWEVIEDHLDLPAVTKVVAVGLVLRWLRSEQLLDPDSDPYDVLLAEVDLLTQRLALTQGVVDDEDDDLDYDDWPGPGGVGSDVDSDDVVSPVFPPVLLASAAELIRAAESSVMLAQVRALLTWIEDGKPLADARTPGPADLESISAAIGVTSEHGTAAAGGTAALVLEWARAAGLVKTVKGRLLPVKALSPLRRKPLELWQRVFDAVGDMGTHFALQRTDHRGEAVEALSPDVFGEIWASFLVTMYQSSGDALPTELLQDIAAETVTVLDFLPTRARREQTAVRSAVSKTLSALVQLGAIEITPVTDGEDRQAIKAIANTMKPEYNELRLTPIGLWASHQRLAEIGGDVVEARELAGRPAADAANRLSQASVEASQAGWAAWVVARGEPAAAIELEQAMLAASDPGGRLGLLPGLLAAGSAGLDAAARLRSGGGIVGSIVVGLLVEHGVINESAVSREESILSMVDVLTVAADDEMLFDMLAEAPPQDQIELIRGIGHSGHPCALRLLDEIADGHPERRVGRAAGKERLRLRSAGAR